jgi:hypothetical protein
LGAFGKLIKAVAGGLVIWAAIATYAGMASFLAGSIVGAPLIPIVAGLAAAAVLTAGFSMLSKIGDLNSPADGKTVVSTKEGGLFELSPNDDLVAAPGAANALANAGSGGGATVASTPQINLSALSAPLNAMINEIKALRADMASGKIAVYMDTAKVTSNISSNVDQGTRNSFNLGSA